MVWLIFFVCPRRKSLYIYFRFIFSTIQLTKKLDIRMAIQGPQRDGLQISLKPITMIFAFAKIPSAVKCLQRTSFINCMSNCYGIITYD